MNNDNGKYDVPASLVHKLLVGIVSSILVIGGYMVAWGINDAGYKSSILTRLTYIEEQVKSGVLPRAEERINGLEMRVENLEKAHIREKD